MVEEELRKRATEKSEKKKDAPEKKKKKKKRKPLVYRGPETWVVMLWMAVIGGAYWFAVNVYFKEIRILASVQDDVDKFEEVKCSPEHAEKPQVPRCTPTKCGRLVLDGLLAPREIEVLKRMAIEGTGALGGGAGGASILELSSSTVSSGEKFQSLFQLREASVKNDNNDNFRIMVERLYSKDNLGVYYSAKTKVATAIETAFGLEDDVLSLAAPTFFSQLSREPAKTENDEYWHSHIDSKQYPSFDYTALVYLNDYEEDFTGGRFFFETSSIAGTEEEAAVEPKAGRVSAFTSGAENPHRVEKVASSRRLAFTMGFTCNPEFAIADPALPPLPDQ